ncbi:MAG TPA: hypothetical protein VFH36_11945 [Acidimicrobiales bacterium]|nr:hypothetical protein [Acidimicrobiales bacterium]
MRRRRLTDTKEGRLVVIALVGGTLMIAASLGNMALADAADDTARDVRANLRRDLATVSDDAIADYPRSAEAIETVAVESLAGVSARVLGSRADGDAVVVAVQSGWGWQVRCVEAELRGDATVLTYVRSQACGR